MTVILIYGEAGIILALVSSTAMLQQARQQGYAVGAFNIHLLDMIQTVVEAAEEARSPLILQTTAGTVKQLGAETIAAVVRAAAERADVPIALHLDHCQDYGMILRCMRAGYTSVMIDQSMHPFEKNAEMTRKVVEAARAMGVNVEAELGKIGGVEDDIAVEDERTALADPDECARFVELTGVDTLAPSIGTAHGIYKGEPQIDFQRLEAIAGKVRVPLVLHGGSGIPEDQIRRCVSLGMAKINIATELKQAFTEALRQFFRDHPDELDPRAYMSAAKQAVKDLATEKMRMCGCAGKA